MAKRTRGTAVSTDAPDAASKVKRQLRRVERQLEKASELEARRTRQLDEARDRRAALEDRRAVLQQPTGREVPTATSASPFEAPNMAAGAPGSASSDVAAPQAYCLRERRTVSIVDARPVTMRNGRPSLVGTCASCGARVVTTSRRAIERAETASLDAQPARDG